MSTYKNFLSSLEVSLRSANRNSQDIELIAVSKKKSATDIQSVIDEGHLSFGENQIQEIEKKWPDLKKFNSNIELHFIGSIQSRKVEQIHKHCEVIHSIDRKKIVKKFAELEASGDIKRKYFIQINTGNESQKSGVLFDEAEEFISDCKSNYNLNIIGLMCLPPINEDPRKHFSKLADLAKKFNLNCLSMGMSGDYQVALECGATHIRIGTHIFGERS
ncbi:MAG: YggS family pyridoxal phosphate enzyme [Candidatus Pelagibacterales bacterium]|nr:MAG: YggS family pyridoxal phosphate enzyme [Pelagibacterales bacterium]